MTDADLDWFVNDRLGLFIHWGLYSLPARHEWVMSREHTKVDEYEKYLTYFDPDLYEPKSWVAQAVAAGMKYVVLTTKHHEGFCLWDSKLTKYTAVNTPYGRDLVRPFVEAAREAGLRVGFYHSLIDWHHPDFPIDGYHPRRDDKDIEAQNADRDMSSYRTYLHGQVRELLTEYGKIDYLFFDFSYPVETGERVWGGKGRLDWDSAALLKTVRELQPGIIVNDRLDIPGDLVTPEQYQPASAMTSGGKRLVWEACQTLNGSWGYDRDNQDYKSVDLLVRMLIDGVSKDGNLLLNVGPTARGEFDPHAAASLAGLGDWMHRHSRSIYGAGPSSEQAPPDARYTQNGSRLYLHLFAWPFQHVHLPNLAGRVEYAQLLNDGSEIQMSELPTDAVAINTTAGGVPAGTLTLKLPTRRPDVAVPVIELFLKEN